ncbi:MAG: hypothetical protein M3137_15345 [Actinomycetota bacterium]|nr:hypothetical protein [Actinomycetota bacterium]
MSQRARRGLVVVGVLVAVVVVGQLLLPGRKPSPQRAGAAPRAAVVADLATASPAAAAGAIGAGVQPLGATVVVAGVPMGYRHDAGGAKAAATSFAEAYGTLMALDEAGAVAAKRTMATTAAADQLVADMRAKLAALRRVWRVGAITYRVAPLAVRVRMLGADAANADVWYVGVVAGKGLPTYEEWVTETYRLVWERNDWHMASDVEAAGPRPDPGRQAPATAAELDARLVGFEAAA